jgi:outer membrane receptor for monomeric catechols
LNDGKLKGLTFGGGWRYQSENVAGINVVSREVYMGNPRSLFDGMVAYSTRGFLGRYREKLAVTYQLNVTNLLDDRTINILKINTDTVTNRPYTVQAIREDPRNATLTVRFAF